ncbi:hypothetical protein Vretimale_1093 [Volvox reticuliferus]|uniref:Uncharacterized protein n=1 Tax=Volvox reticuliferus TaxID=1737510 RepID=A0A8J4FXZ8_9CHLO|nr:hypothetical protein Vretimale_1093 [Volvox reticuliferus]
MHNEVATIRGQMSAKDSHISQLMTELSRAVATAGEANQLRSQVAVLEARIGTLTRQLSESESGRRLFNELEVTHSSMQRRLAAARASDEIYNSNGGGGGGVGVGGGEGSGGGGVGGDGDASGRGKGGGPRRERERHLPPTGFV